MWSNLIKLSESENLHEKWSELDMHFFHKIVYVNVISRLGTIPFMKSSNYSTLQNDKSLHKGKKKKKRQEVDYLPSSAR